MTDDDLPWPDLPDRNATRQQTFADRPLRALLYMAIASVIGAGLGWALAGIYVLFWG